MKRLIYRIAATPYSKMFGFAILVNMLFVVATLVLQNNLPPEVPLFYGRAQDEAQLSSSKMLALPALISAAICMVNFGLCLGIKNVFLRKVLASLSISVTILSSITILKIIGLVGSF